MRLAAVISCTADNHVGRESREQSHPERRGPKLWESDRGSGSGKIVTVRGATVHFSDGAIPAA
jgi:hypothetical protein